MKAITSIVSMPDRNSNEYKNEKETILESVRRMKNEERLCHRSGSDD